MSTPDYKIIEDFKVIIRGLDKTITAGSFVRPISTNWVPIHIINADKDLGWLFKHNEETCCYCYTHYGILSIPRRLIRRV